MDTEFLDREYAGLRADLTALVNSPGRALGGYAEKNIILQRISDNRWHARHPGLTGSWRLAFRDSIIGECEDDSRIPRFETEAEVRVWIANDPTAQKWAGQVTAVHRPSRYVLEGLIAPVAMGEAA